MWTTCEIENFIPNRNINILGGIGICSDDLRSLSNITLQVSGQQAFGRKYIL